ncbi:AraC-like DNA-binding protein [Dongia mobilis]|uniref:AraC-like DNA-binding protein n=1 Tax=Dongia mobilis TaxID=578943 RepID=A0A4R6WS18_9PROT|nr:helix-turn-helix transcriptional regulator [Dongia mobilis]TDQ84306.1 AraC-like DNA-binding protein [Dongia mobilis]
MVRNVRSADYESIPRPIVAVGIDMPADHEIGSHSHARGQLLHGVSGVMTVVTEHGTWIVPPDQAVWIPPGIIHSVRAIGPVAMRSVYVTPDRLSGFHDKCQVLAMSPLMRALVNAAVDMPVEYDIAGRDGLAADLLLMELRALPTLPLSLPLPRDTRLVKRCRRFLQAPRADVKLDHWAADLAMSRRTLTRHFKLECGMSLAAWARRACLFAALPRLAGGEKVTAIALDLGYDSPAAFTTMFRRTLGFPPSRYPGLAAG